MSYKGVSDANRRRRVDRRHYRHNPRLLRAWRKGYAACLQGWGKDDCPYTSHKARAFRRAWLGGFYCAIRPAGQTTRPTEETEAVRRSRAFREERSKTIARRMGAAGFRPPYTRLDYLAYARMVKLGKAR